MIRKIPQENRDEYLSAVLRLYLELPETPERVSLNDRQNAARLQTRGIDLATIESAFLLGSLRRLGRAPDMPPLSPIRSLAYFFPVIEEVLNQPIPDGYREYLRRKLQLIDGRNRIKQCS